MYLITQLKTLCMVSGEGKRGRHDRKSLIDIGGDFEHYICRVTIW